MKCKNCGEDMSGDGHTAALHCPSLDASDREPDADPLHCDAPDDKPSAARPQLWAVLFKDGIPVNVSLARTQKSSIRLTCMRFGETWKSLKARGMRCVRVTVEVVPDETK